MLVNLATVAGHVEGFGRSWSSGLAGIAVDLELAAEGGGQHTLGHLERVSWDDGVRSERSPSPLYLLAPGRMLPCRLTFWQSTQWQRALAKGSAAMSVSAHASSVFQDLPLAV